MEDLLSHLDAASRAAVLMVAADYDGTLAPIVNDPAKAVAPPETLAALRALSETSRTHVAIISGRSLSDLQQHLPDLEHVHLVGSHGAEFAGELTLSLDPKSAALLQKATDAAQRISAKTPGTLVELKPAGITFHFRNTDPARGKNAADELLKAMDGEPGLHMRHGKKILEFSVVKTNKGEALRKLRDRLSATAVIFLGDDLTDEDVFATLSGPDVGIKVGPGPTAAKFRVNSTTNAAKLLASLAQKRAA